MAKIVGTSEDGFLVSMRATEIANLCGFYWGGEDGCPEPKPGAEIDISGMYKRLWELERDATKLRGIAVDFRSMAERCESSAPLIFPEPQKTKKKDGDQP